MYVYFFEKNNNNITVINNKNIALYTLNNLLDCDEK